MQPVANVGGHGRQTSRPNKHAVWNALSGLTGRDLQALTFFASRQLRRVGLPATSAEDMVQQALLMLAVGASKKSQGRHPRNMDVMDHAAFLNYVRGIVSSLIDSRRKVRENRFAHTRWEDDQISFLTVSGSGSNVPAEVAFKDLADLLYTRLDRRVPEWLRAPLMAWREQGFQSDQIPLQGAHRQLRLELRTLAAEVMADLGEFHRE